MSDTTLYEETFNINSTIADKYDRVTRVLAQHTMPRPHSPST
jgi:hypothetical protein